jgi:hypothetical protein
MTTESYRKMCLKQQTELRQVMMSVNHYDQAMRLFLDQHAMLHSAKIAPKVPWSFEDEIFNDVSEEQTRRIPQNCDHSIVWLIWHIARCEDITMNLLVAGSPQILNQDNWLGLMQTTVCDTGNAMDRDAVTKFSSAINIEALRTYRLAVGRRTRKIIKQIRPETLTQKVDPARLQRVMAERAVDEAASGIVDYWGGRNIAGLLLMPATRHNLIHLNEALLLKRKQQ